MEDICGCRLKFLVFTLAVLLVQDATALPRHIRSLDEGGNATRASDSDFLPNSTAPLPPADGGAKTALKPEMEAFGHRRQVPPESQPPNMSPHVNIVSNETLPVPRPAPEGRAGFGGPVLPEEEATSTGAPNRTVLGVRGEPGVQGVPSEEGGAGGQDGVRRGTGGSRTFGCPVCPPGYGVVTPCSAEADTVCAKCEPGTFSTGFSATDACAPCSPCTSGFYQRTPCVTDSDVLCGACHSRGNGFGNEDFLRQCEGATIDSTTSDEGSDISIISTQTPLLLRPVESLTASPKVRMQHRDTQKSLAKTAPPRVGKAQAKEREPVRKVKPGGFQWPILLAVLASGTVFFIIGIFASKMCKKAALKRKQAAMTENGDFNGSVRNTSFRRVDNDTSLSQGSTNYPESDARSPLNPAK